MLRTFQISVLFSLVLISFSTQSQDLTKGMQKKALTGQPNAKILLVPYEGKMLLSDINRELGTNHDMSLSEIKSIFREGLCQIITMEASDEYDVLDMINSGEDVVYQDIQYTFNSLGYQYTEVPEAPEEAEDKNLLDKVADKIDEKRNPDQQGRGTTVKKGEIRSEYDDKERFMDARILNPAIVDYLSEQYAADYLFIITQLDIKVLRTPEMPEWTTADRRIKMHYTILDSSGEKVAGSAAYAYFGPEEKNIFNIIKNYFPKLAEQALACLPNEEEKTENENAEKEPKEPQTAKGADDNDDDF